MLGIDVSKSHLACTLLDPDTKQTCWTRQVQNNAAGLKELLHATPLNVPWVMEPTGRYSTGVAAGAVQAGRQVLLAQPKRAKHFLHAVQARAKTDRLDSAGLALYALSQTLSPYPLKPAMAEQLDQLLSARKGLSRAIASLQQQQQELPHAATTLQAAGQALQEQRAALDREIAVLGTRAAETKELPWAALPELRRVPGIGKVTASTVISRLASHPFAHSDAFVAYCGLDVVVRQSGVRRGQGGLTKQGDAELRRLLYLAAQASLRAKDSPFKAQYERERAKGMSSTAALCAVARKMARLCWSMARHGTSYDSTRVYQQPKKDAPEP